MPHKNLKVIIQTREVHWTTHAKSKGSDIAEVLQNNCAQHDFVFLSFSIIHIFIFLLSACACENHTYSHGCSCCCTGLQAALCKASIHMSQGQIAVRPTQSSDGCATETPMGKSRAMWGKGAQATCQRCLMGNKSGNCRLGLKFS